MFSGFDARPIWTALNLVAVSGRISKQLNNTIQGQWGETAISLGIRHYLLRGAMEELKDSKKAIPRLLNRVLEPSYVICGDEIENSKHHNLRLG